MPMPKKRDRREYSRQYYYAHRERILADKRAAKVSRRPERIAYQLAYHAAHKKQRKIRDLAKFYGMTLAGYEHLFASQGRVCAVCTTDDFGPRGPFLDHDHRTGKVRGILCYRCNCALGYAGDSPELLEDLAAYVRFHKNLNLSRATEPTQQTGKAVNAD